MDRRLPASLPVRICPEANRLHRKDARSYAHTYHRSGVICVARTLFHLPPRHLFAILAHEVGHLLAGEDGTEADADRLAETFFSVTLHYTDSKHGQDLQTISHADAMKIRTFPFIMDHT